MVHSKRASNYPHNSTQEQSLPPTPPSSTSALSGEHYRPMSCQHDQSLHSHGRRGLLRLLNHLLLHLRLYAFFAFHALPTPPIEGNVDCLRHNFYQEERFDVSTFRDHSQTREGFELRKRYLLDPFMAPSQFFYPQEGTRPGPSSIFL